MCEIKIGIKQQSKEVTATKSKENYRTEEGKNLADKGTNRLI
jgi:hypothetical protein